MKSASTPTQLASSWQRSLDFPQPPASTESLIKFVPVCKPACELLFVVLLLKDSGLSFEVPTRRVLVALSPPCPHGSVCVTSCTVYVSEQSRVEESAVLLPLLLRGAGALVADLGVPLAMRISFDQLSWVQLESVLVEIYYEIHTVYH